MSTIKRVQCRGCGRTIIWTITPSGASSPVDPEPAEDGTVLVLRSGTLGAISVVLSGYALTLARQHHTKLRTTHWATCPDAEKFKRTRGNKRRASQEGEEVTGPPKPT